MFGVIPKPLWEKSCPADHRNRIALGCQCLLLRGDGRVVVVDAGLGGKLEARSREIYAMDTAIAPMEQALAAHGLTPAQVTDVVITHLHFDHAGGLTQHADDGSLKPVFPHAHHWVQADHLDYARGPWERERGSFPPENFEPLARRGLLRVVRGEEILLAGLQVIPLQGHTRAMQALLIDGDPPLFYPADLIPTQAHLQLSFVMAYDIAPLITIEEKRRHLERAAREGWEILFGHEPYETRGTIEMFQGKYRLGRAP